MMPGSQNEVKEASQPAVPVRKGRRLLFAVDHVFSTDADGTVFTMGGKLPYEAWETYLDNFDEVVVLARGQTGKATDKLSVSSGPGVVHHLAGARRGWKRIWDVRASARAVKQLVEEADAVVARIPGEIGLAAAAAARKLGKPYMVELVACPWDAFWYNGSLIAKLYAPIITLRTRFEVRSAPLVRYVTEQFLQRRYPARGEWISASNVMLELGVSPPPRRDFREKKGDAKIVFGTIGALTMELKGISTALKALADASDVIPAFEYRVLGEGDPTRYVAQAQTLGLADRVHFDGVLPAGEQVFKWLDTIDIYLQPSFQEGLPRSLIEALSRGTLAIGSTAGGIPELLPAERLHAPGDVGQLAQIIGSLANAPEATKQAESERNVLKASNYDRVKLTRRRRDFCRKLVVD